MAKTDKATVIEVPQFEQRQMRVMVCGRDGSELITHRFSEKARKMIEDSQQGNKTSKAQRAARNPEEEYEAAMYRLEDGRPAVKAGAFKAAMVSAAKTVVDGVNGTDVQKGISIIEQLVPIYGSEPYMRVDTVRLPNGSADIRYRPAWPEWACEFTIEYLPNKFNEEFIMYLLNTAGFAVGVFEMRPEKCATESHGRFTIANEEQVKYFLDLAKKNGQLDPKRKRKAA